MTEVDHYPNEAWLFSFGYGHEYPNRYVRIEGTYLETRDEMVRRYGVSWAFQYPESEEAELNDHDMWPLVEDDENEQG